MPCVNVTMVMGGQAASTPDKGSCFGTVDLFIMTCSPTLLPGHDNNESKTENIRIKWGDWMKCLVYTHTHIFHVVA